MKNILFQQELLLVTGTALLNNEYCEKTNAENNGRPMSASEKLEEACCSGLLNDVLARVFSHCEMFSNLYLWHSRPGISTLLLTLGLEPGLTEPHFSIDPVSFFSPVICN